MTGRRHKGRFEIFILDLIKKGGENQVFSPLLVVTTHAVELGARSMKMVLLYRAESAPYFPNMALGSQTTTSGKIVQIVTPIAWRIKNGTTPR
jgi:hypothetical protein